MAKNHLEEALAWLQQGAFTDAEIAARQYTAENPDDGQGYNLLAAALAHQGKSLEAQNILRDALVKLPTNHKLHHNLAELLSRNGEAAEAIRHYEAAVDLAPDNLASLTALVNLLDRAGNLPLAIKYLTRQVSISLEIHSLLRLAEMLRHTGDIAAARSLLLAHQIAFSESPEYLLALGTIQLDLQEYEAAEENLHSVIEKQPENSLALNNLGAALQGQDRDLDAIPFFQRAIQLAPDEPNFKANLAASLRNRGRYKEAIDLLAPLSTIFPKNPFVLTNLGLTLILDRQPEAAIEPLRACQELDLNNPNYLNNLGAAYEASKHLDAASSIYTQLLDKHPQFIPVHNNLGNIAVSQLRLNEAIQHYSIYLQHYPNDPDIRLNRALAFLLQGNFPAGWEEFEWRIHAPKKKRFFEHLPAPLWHGEDLTNKNILLFSEDGFGDTIQFIRYAEFVKQQGAQVVVRCPAPLVELLATCKGIDEIDADGTPLPPLDYCISLMSLPRIHGTQPTNTLCSNIPYIQPPSARTARWQEELKKIQGLKIGIAWGGNPNHYNDKNRSCPFEYFADMVSSNPEINFISLQVGLPSQALNSSSKEIQQRIIDRTQLINDFSDTAALISNLDHIITVDTSIVHLAGALGKPTWLLLPYSPDWRWMTDTDTTFWYSSIKLIRQSNPSDWKTVFTTLNSQLNKYCL